MATSKKVTKKYTKSKNFLRKIPGSGLLKRKKLIFAILVLVSVAIASYFFVLKDIPKVTRISNNDFPQSTKIYDRHGELLYTIFAQRNQTYIPLEEIPKNLQQATIAIEDRDFYNHGAIDIRGITRALYANTFQGDFQGGSTITQQLVKNSLLTLDRTISRKVREIVLSFAVEALYSKDKILEMYLNKVAYGGTAWGVEAASQAYFGKPAKKLTLSESAFIAGLPESPSAYSPFGSHPELGKQRQHEVLRKMREQGYISGEEEENAKNEELAFLELQNEIKAPHFVFYIKDLLTQKYGSAQVEQGGLRVKTTLDLNIQEMTQQEVASEVAELENNNATNGSALVTNPGTGEVLAMVGSKDFFDTENDGNVNVTIAKRQPGSSIKPINYATGLINGYTAATPIIDNKTCFPSGGGRNYCPVNYDRSFHGVTQMRYALANSYNIPAVKMLQANGLEAMIATASAMGITTFEEPENYGLSLTLGGGEVKMIDMAQSFGVFANLGYKVDLQPILKVTDKNGEVLEEYDPAPNPIYGEKVIPEGVAFIISHILQDNSARSPAFGSNSPLRVGNYPVSVKTGTTDDYRDNWTIGYTPSYVVTTWVGNNDNTPMSGITSGVTGAAPLWNGIMSNLLEGTDPEPLKQPASVIGMNICSDSGLLPQPEGAPYRCPTRFEYFVKGTEPTKTSPGRQKFFFDTTTWEIAKPDQTENVEEREEVVIFGINEEAHCVTCPKPQPQNEENEEN